LTGARDHILPPRYTLLWVGQNPTAFLGRTSGCSTDTSTMALAGSRRRRLLRGGNERFNQGVEPRDIRSRSDRQGEERRCTWLRGPVSPAQAPNLSAVPAVCWRCLRCRRSHSRSVPASVSQIVQLSR